MTKKLDFDTDFLDGLGSKNEKDATDTSQEKLGDFLDGHASKKFEGQKKQQKTHAPSDVAPMSNADKIILLGVGIALLVIVFPAMMLNQGSSPEPVITATTKSPPLVVDAYIPPAQIKPAVKTYVEPQKTANQTCVDTYGTHSYSTGEKNAAGGAVCDCKSGYAWNGGQTECVVVPPQKSNSEVCQADYGPNSTWSGSNNDKGGLICDCQTGYEWNASRTQCIQISRDKQCASQWANSKWSGQLNAQGGNVCDCQSGYSWNTTQTACLADQVNINNGHPTNSRPSSYSSTGWFCNSGYKQIGSQCEQVINPPNSRLSDYSSTGWFCNSGYKQVGSQCEQVINPPNSYLSDYSSTGWFCSTGYVQVNGSCVVQ